jgi:hypothetical protein
MTQDRAQRRALVNTVMNLQFPWGDNFLICSATVSFLSKTLHCGVTVTEVTAICYLDFIHRLYVL